KIPLLLAQSQHKETVNMSQIPSRRPGPPHNPDLRELIEGKRDGTAPVKKADAIAGFRGWHERGFLPHRDAPGLTQFVTFRLADSFPSSLRSEWQGLLQQEDSREKRKQLEAYLDKGRGQCALQKPEISELTETTLRHFHCDRYELRAWVVMPNHVHVLFKVDAIPMSRIVGGWKQHIAHEANKILGA